MTTERVTLSRAYRYRKDGDTKATVYGPGENIEIPAAMADALRRQGALAPAKTDAGIAETDAGANVETPPTQTPIPSDFPGRSFLVEAGYKTIEDVAGLAKADLVALEGIGDATAARIIEAAQAALSAAGPTGSGVDTDGEAGDE